MRILIITDKFKFTFSSLEVAQIIKNAIKSEVAFVSILPVSDGGEGFLEAINFDNSFSIIKSNCHNPIFEPIEAPFLLKNKTAYLEYAQTGGLFLLPSEHRNPLYTTSYGLGEQIKQAIEIGANKIVIGVGGSASNDGGMGMAAALGVNFFDKKNKLLKPIGCNLSKIDRIDRTNMYFIDDSIKIIVAVDVQNKMDGEEGATKIFASQKGANPKEVEYLENGMLNYIKKINAIPEMKINTQPGEGAAGGLAGGISAFFNADIIDGASLIIQTLDIKNKIKNSDIIITGEGKLDEQSFNGKIVGKIYDIASKYKKDIVVICGLSEYYNKNINAKIINLFENKVNIETAKKQSEILIREKINNYINDSL